MPEQRETEATRWRRIAETWHESKHVTAQEALEAADELAHHLIEAADALAASQENLRRYGEHIPGCSRAEEGEHRPCDCGLAAALNSTQTHGGGDSESSLEEGRCPGCGGDAGNSVFSRSICPEPCGSMHYYCAECGALLDDCPLDSQTHGDGEK